MEENSVYLLYEGDEWLSMDSMVLMGIFTSDEYLKVNAEKLIRERAKQHIRDAEGNFDPDYFEDCKTFEEKTTVVVDDILTELMSRGSTSGWTTNYSITSATLNELGEI